MSSKILYLSIASLSTLILSSYTFGFNSRVDSGSQPSLITMDLWVEDDYDTMSIQFGWDRAYIFQAETHTELEEIDEDMKDAGEIYIGLSILSFILFFLNILVGLITKNKYWMSVFIFISWILLLSGVIQYVLALQDLTIYIELYFSYHWKYGSGLLFNFMGLCLMPLLGLMLFI